MIPAGVEPTLMKKIKIPPSSLTIYSHAWIELLLYSNNSQWYRAISCFCSVLKMKKIDFELITSFTLNRYVWSLSLTAQNLVISTTVDTLVWIDLADEQYSVNWSFNEWGGEIKWKLYRKTTSLSVYMQDIHLWPRDIFFYLGPNGPREKNISLGHRWIS